MLDPKLYRDISGLRVIDVINILLALPTDIQCKPFHVCGSTTMYLHASKDGDDGDYLGVSLDNDSLDKDYSERGADDNSAHWS